MAKPELGSKRVCVSCATRFFDLGKSPAVCPKCKTEQPAEQPRLRRPALPAEEKRVKKPVPVPLNDEDEIEAVPEEVEEDAEVIDDAGDLEDDADGLGPDLEVAADHDETER